MANQNQPKPRAAAASQTVAPSDKVEGVSAKDEGRPDASVNASKATDTNPVKGPVIPGGFVFARWTGAGTFDGVCYTREGQQLPSVRGPMLGYFPEKSVQKLAAHFEVIKASDAAASSSKDDEPGPRPVSDVKAPPGFVFARWHGLGTFLGEHLTFPDQEKKPYAKGPTVGFFPEKSVQKLAAHFERL